MLDKIKLNIISNRKLCENENLEKQIEKIFSAYEMTKRCFHSANHSQDDSISPG